MIKQFMFIFLIMQLCGAANAIEFNSADDYILFDGKLYIEVTYNYNFTDVEFSLMFNTFTNETDMILLSCPTFNIKCSDCGIPIEIGETYRIEGVFNESGKFVTCILYDPLNYMIRERTENAEFTGIIDDLKVYNKPVKYNPVWIYLQHIYGMHILSEGE